jgi:hypothetical protein
MQRIYNSKSLWFISIFLFILMSTINGHSAGFIAEWEPFKTKRELSLSVVDVGPDKMLFLKDEYTKMGNGNAIERDAAERKDDSAWNVFKFRSVSISFSRTMIEQMQQDVNKKSGDGNDKLQAIKALPSSFLTSPYRDSFQSIGKIFEPQVNLSIEF